MSISSSAAVHPQYDFLVEGFVDDIEHYARLAAEYSGGEPIVEIACGIGRISIPLRERGFTVIGLEVNREMIEEARETMAGRGWDIPLIRADYHRLPLRGRFSLVLFPFNSLSLVHDLSDIHACLDQIKALLTPGGRFAFDLFNPRLEMLARNPFDRTVIGRFPSSVSDADVTIRETVDYDRTTQICRSVWYFSYGRKGPEEVIHNVNRMFFPQELRLLMQHHGFVIEKCCGDFRRSPFSGDSFRQVFVCRKDEGAVYEKYQLRRNLVRSAPSSRSKIAIVDFGGQYAHLINSRIRALGVYGEIVDPTAFDPVSDPDLCGVILSGGPHSVAETGHPTIIFDPGSCPLPILGLCYGHQLLAVLSGGTVKRGTTREYGATRIKTVPGAVLFAGLPEEQQVWMSHGDHVADLPEGFRITASSDDLRVAAYESADGRRFGFQFHPEVTPTEFGNRMLERFLERCGAARNWNPGSCRQRLVEEIRVRSGSKDLFLLLSGGVDSLVALALCLEAVGPHRVHSLHVDTGFMRDRESEEIIGFLEKHGFSDITVAQAEGIFLERLGSVVDPEAKRRIIGETFVEVLNDHLGVMKLADDWLLVQGTIYPDTIESGGTKNAEKIKTHHNRVEAIERMIAEGRVLEPLRELYKDEVRQVGLELGLPPELVHRHPFPGPGLAVRILGSETEEAAPGFDVENARLLELIRPFGLEGLILPVRSVGVQGDSRSYLHPAAIWNADGSSDPDWDRLLEATRVIVNTLKSVNRAVFATRPLTNCICLRRQMITKERADRLRHVDAVIRRETADLEAIWQFPVISLPAVNEIGSPVFVLRPITSDNAMTAEAFRMPVDRFQKLLAALRATGEAGEILYDLTAKPPGTIEWE